MSDAGYPAVAVIVVNWNHWRMSLECLESLRGSVDANWHLFLVDNASTDDSRAHLAALGHDVTVIFSNHNGGWAGGNNLGVQSALNAGYKWLFLLNNDALVTPNTIASLVEAADRGPVPVLGPLQRDGADEPLNFIGAAHDDVTGGTIFTPAAGVDATSLPTIYDTAFIKGAGLFAAREHFEKIGMFDDRFYLNYDETDWCFRARAGGYPVQMTSRSEIHHSGSVSIGGGLSPLNVYFVARNSLLFAEKHATRRQRLHQLVELARWAARLTPPTLTRHRIPALIFGRSKLAIAARLGVRDYFLRRFGDCPPAIRTLSGSR